MTSLSAEHGRPPASPRETPAGGPRAPRRRRRIFAACAAAALLAQMAAAMLTAAARQSPTNDEPIYLVTGASYLYERDLRYNPEHPPLGKLLIGAGVALSGARLDTAFTGGQKEAGRHLLYGSGNDAQRTLLAARLPVIALTLLFGLVVFAFARDLAGAPGGIAALALYAFSPDVIAHGSLATLDVPMAGFLLTAAWLLWRARRRPRLHLPLAGAALGAALATKMSALPAIPVLLGLAALAVWTSSVRGSGRPRAPSGRPDGPSRRRLLAVCAASAAGVAVVAVAVVWASYLAADPRLRWTAPDGVPSIGGARGLVADLLPFPEPFRDGMRVQFGFEDLEWTGFLFGEVYKGSRWYYLPAALLVKTPLGTLALWAAGAAAFLALPRLRPAAPFVLVPAAVLLAAAMTGDRDLGVRYAIFVPMFLAVAAAGTTLVRWRWAPAVTAALVLLTAVSSLRTFPLYLPYSNEAFGGPSRTRLHLHDSNVDWGQDLPRLADRLRERYAGENVWLAYKGEGVPAYYGIRASDPLTAPPGRVRGLLVVSNSWIAKSDPRLTPLIATAEPVDQVGHSITIFRRP
ncbi:dolichyl-phosphate-mannose-protein mannosyltransferase [Actinomadura hallensis]|uniref:Dolichyl-phosphate-mannose-protein mannosyltransferase n=1 Tax=Actinomadura hallensis TaxID=337895 RepID=A0A543IDR5_9ACTN|nr:phospholipid carrier-dependent glycosyltransferase [Actinomadura hallensis]TQM68716.1 dolichyl-phosphate-mannose-protein mannosyltransferase [Actinomadura hallensis]